MYKYIEVDEIKANIVIGAQIKDIDEVMKEAHNLADTMSTTVRLKFCDNRAVRISPASHEKKPLNKEDIEYLKNKINVYRDLADIWQDKYNRIVKLYTEAIVKERK
jgi:hypothetical protein